MRGPAKSPMTFGLQTILVQDQTFHLFNHAQKVTHIDLNKLRVKLATVKDSTLVRLPPSEDTFKQHVLRSSYKTKIWLNESSNAWQGQNSVQDKFCSKQTQPLLQTDLPLHVHTRSCKKSDDI
jgi:hypothetical protein